MVEIISKLFGYIGVICIFMGSCLGALLIFWHYGKFDIKEYLYGKEKK